MMMYLTHTVLLKCNVALAHQMQMLKQSPIKGAWHLVCLQVSIQSETGATPSSIVDY